MRHLGFCFLPLLLVSCGNGSLLEQSVQQALEIVDALTDEALGDSFNAPSVFSFNEIRKEKKDDGTFATTRTAVTLDLERHYLCHVLSKNGVEIESYYYIKDGNFYSCEAMNGSKFYSVEPASHLEFASITDVTIAKETFKVAALNVFTDFHDALNLIQNTTEEKLQSFENQGMTAEFESNLLIKGNRSVEASNRLLLKKDQDAALSTYNGVIENGLPITSSFESEVSGVRRKGNAFDAVYKNVNIHYPNLSGWTKY